MNFWLVFLGGGLGSVSRYVLAGWVYRWFGTGFPYGTLCVNLAGCWLIGFLTALTEDKFLLSPASRVFLLTGFISAFTTFATFIFETSRLIQDGEIGAALANVCVSVLSGFVLFWFGLWAGRVL